MSADPTFLTGLGAALSLFLCGGGSAYGTAHASVFAIRHRDKTALIPVIQAGVLALYGIIIGFNCAMKAIGEDAISSVEGYRFLSAGLCVGLACHVSGVAMGLYLKMLNKEGYYYVRKGKADAKDDAPKKFDFVTFVLCLIYLEAIGLYGLIIALFLTG